MGRKARSNRSAGVRGEPDSQTWEILKSLVSGAADASELLEMYYWTREPGIVELIRAYLDMPDRAQRHLSGFLLKNRPQTVSTVIDQQGRLVLTSIEEESRSKKHG
jgi:hypothetical protein